MELAKPFMDAMHEARSLRSSYKTCKSCDYRFNTLGLDALECPCCHIDVCPRCKGPEWFCKRCAEVIHPEELKEWHAQTKKIVTRRKIWYAFVCPFTILVPILAAYWVVYQGGSVIVMGIFIPILIVLLLILGQPLPAINRRKNQMVKIFRARLQAKREFAYKDFLGGTQVIP